MSEKTLREEISAIREDIAGGVEAMDESSKTILAKQIVCSLTGTEEPPNLAAIDVITNLGSILLGILNDLGAVVERLVVKAEEK